MSVVTYIAPCPECGTLAHNGGGILVQKDNARFPFAIECRNCGHSTPFVKTKAIAVTAWESKIGRPS